MITDIAWFMAIWLAVAVLAAVVFFCLIKGGGG